MDELTTFTQNGGALRIITTSYRTDRNTGAHIYLLYIALKAQKLAPSTIEGYHDLTQRIYPLIGELRIREITSTDMEDLYSALRKEHKKTSVAVGCDNLADVIREKKFGKTASLSLKSLTKDKSRIPNSVLARIAKVSPSVIASALNNNPISEISAEKISTALGWILIIAQSQFRKLLTTQKRRVSTYALLQKTQRSVL